MEAPVKRICLFGLLALAAHPSIAQSVRHHYKFPPTVDAPWAHEEDDDSLDIAPAGAGVCRSAPFSTTSAYGPLGTNVDMIVGDGVNTVGFSNQGCATA